jgi:alpha-L-fucosidase
MKTHFATLDKEKSMKKHRAGICLSIALLTSSLLATSSAQTADRQSLPITAGAFRSSWQSLQEQFQCPDWFRDAKFGIWAHWGAQCQPEQGDWYARNMYVPSHSDYKFHVQNYGHPSQFGFKDVIHVWKAQNFDPDKLIALYKRAGAKYFVAMANHHCNFDNFNSKYQPWNSVAIGPKKDLVGMWAEAARQQGLRFGVSSHAARAWTWYEVAQGSDKDGPRAGVPYDGKLTKADGKGQWWDGLDPQDLYTQNHPIGAKPDAAYCDKFYLRTKQLIEDYKPDLLYFDDSVLPLRSISENYGLSIAADLSNTSAQQHGRNEAVMTTKRLEDPLHRKSLVWDIERGKSENIEPFPWQTDTCIGSWHYNRDLFLKHRYKTAGMVITMLVDIVSKNGNLLLSIPVRGDGTIDEDETKLLESMAAWMSVNSECIFGTRPWKIYGEGPATAGQEVGRFGGVSDTPKKPFTAADIRFTTKGDTLYAICLAVPATDVRIVSLGKDSKVSSKTVATVQLLGSKGKLDWAQRSDALVIQCPAQLPSEHAVAFKIAFAR